MNAVRTPRPLSVRTFGPVPTRIPICNTNVLVIERGGSERILTGAAHRWRSSSRCGPGKAAATRSSWMGVAAHPSFCWRARTQR